MVKAQHSPCHQMSKFYKYLGFSFLFFDVLIVLLTLAVIFILITGGKLIKIGNTRVLLQGIENPISFLYMLSIFRCFLFRKTPFLGIVPFDIKSLTKKCQKLCKKLYVGLLSLESYKVYRIVAFVMGISLIFKMFTAYHFYGFFSGDDVEIHEMTFSLLFNWGTKAWDLRSPFFPMIFIYPIQATLHSLGVNDPFFLIFAGRLVVVLFSVLNLYLVFRIAVRLFNSIPVGLFSMFFLALSKLHTTMGSSELPRTIASTFILISLLLLLKKKNHKIFVPLAGVALAVGASIRFGEVIFIAAAFLYLILHKRMRHAVLIVAVFGSAFVLINYISDVLYWGEPFFSLKNIVDYTLIKKESTRGFQPFFYYLLSIGLWSNFFSFGLLLYSLRQNTQKIWLWVATPLLFLSLLPHKEPRYLLPIIPFFCIMVGLGAWGLLKNIHDNNFELKIHKGIFKPIFILTAILFGLIFQAHKDYRYSYLVFIFSALIILIYALQRQQKKNRKMASSFKMLRSPKAAALLLFAIMGVFLFETNGYYFQKSESGVEMARFLFKQPDNQGVSVEEIWRAGGMLYLWEKYPLENIDQASLSDREGFISKITKESVIWVGIRDKSVKKHGYDTLLNDLGFTEVAFSRHTWRETYRLFKKDKHL